MTARGVNLDIVERTPNPEEVRALNVVCPNYVAINGLPVLVPSDTEVEIVASETGAVTARLSLFVGRLRIHAEAEPVDDADPPLWAELAATQDDPRYVGGQIRGYITNAKMALALQRITAQYQPHQPPIPKGIQ
jgi:hypothetical protein